MNKVLVAYLALAYSPVSNYSFFFIKKEKEVQEVLRDSHLYMIAQRPELKFQQVWIRDGESIEFEIVKLSTGSRTHGKIDLSQVPFLASTTAGLEVEVGSYDKNRTFDSQPYDDVDGLKFWDGPGTAKFLHWLTPEKLFYEVSRGMPGVTGLTNLEGMRSYQILYIGQATDQDIWNRLTGHSKLQDVLSVENPIRMGALPTHEVVLLLFKVSGFHSVRTPDSASEIAPEFIAQQPPDENTIILDAEKALVHSLHPTYNTIRYADYPKSIDGLFPQGFTTVSYVLKEDIEITCNGRSLLGSLDGNEASYIGVSMKENTVSIIRSTQ